METPSIEELKWQYREALITAEPYFRRAQEVQDMYEGRNFDSGTGTDIRFPLIYQLTEEILPGIWFGMFPRDKMIRLSERFESGADFDRIKLAETYLHFLIKHSGLRTEGIKTIKDGLKFGKGYGIIELERVSIPEEVRVLLVNAGRREVAAQTETRNNIRYMPRYRYIPYPFVCPTPDGDTPENASGVYVLRFYTEAEILNMYEQDEALPEEHRKLKLSAREVLDYTAEHQMDYGTYPLYWIMASVAGMEDRLLRYRQMVDIQRMHNKRRKSGARMLTVPVLQCKYQQNEYWLANGKQMIYEVDAGDKVCMNVVAASANLDSGDWWAQGPVTAASDLHWATNVLWRMLLDVAARVGDPIKLINTAILENAPDDVTPGTVLKSRSIVGDLRNAFGYASPPPIPDGFASLGAVFNEQAAKTVGRPQQLSGQGGAGIMRGGSSAFESWLATATGQEKLRSALIQTGWLVPTIELIMRQAQLSMPAKMRFSIEDEEGAEKKLHTITREDFAREYDVELDPDAKYNLSSSERAIRLNEYNLILKDNPDFDWKAAAEYAMGDQPVVARLRATPEVREKQMQQLQERAQAQQQAKAQEQGATEGAAMQGVQGGMEANEQRRTG